MKEQWVDIDGYEGRYQISNIGNVKALAHNRGNRYYLEKILTPTSMANNYQSIGLWNNGFCKRFLVHRLVVSHFIGEIKRGLVVNHIDNNPANNILTNLEITTQSENIKHAFRQGRATPPQKGKSGKFHNHAKSIVAFKDGSPVGSWGSIVEMKNDLNIKSNDISSVVSGKRKHLGGFTFQYKNQL